MNRKILLFFTVLTCSLALASCDKNCFDQQLYNTHKDAACTADCPGVKGCDGKIYCNECEANRQGISVEQ